MAYIFSVDELVAGDRDRLLAAAQACLPEVPRTITFVPAPRSPGGRHDYYSEADYWWPATNDPQGSYVRRDGLSNPDAFAGHRRLMRRLSMQVPALTMGFLLTGEPRYASHAARHLDAWFVDASTRMQPHLCYAQAIPGRVTGRGIGIIDTIHLAEVARATRVLADAGALPLSTVASTTDWFRRYVQWLYEHPHGQRERDEPNNHGSAWLFQVAAFADLLQDAALLTDCRERFRSTIVPGQIAPDGGFPLERARTKPYAYSLFNLDLMAGLCQLLSTPDEDLWSYETSDGRGTRRAMAFMVPFIVDKTAWPHEPDVMHDEHWPVRHPCLLFAGWAYGVTDYIELWRKLNPDPQEDEIIRNYPIRQPFLWIKRDPALGEVPGFQPQVGWPSSF